MAQVSAIEKRDSKEINASRINRINGNAGKQQRMMLIRPLKQIADLIRKDSEIHILTAETASAFLAVVVVYGGEVNVFFLPAEGAE